MQRFGDDNEEIHLADQQADSGALVACRFGESAMAPPVGVAGLAAAAARRNMPRAGEQGLGFSRRRHSQTPDPRLPSPGVPKVPIRTLQNRWGVPLLRFLEPT